MAQEFEFLLPQNIDKITTPGPVIAYSA